MAERRSPWGGRSNQQVPAPWNQGGRGASAPGSGKTVHAGNWNEASVRNAAPEQQQQQEQAFLDEEPQAPAPYEGPGGSQERDQAQPSQQPPPKNSAVPPPWKAPASVPSPPQGPPPQRPSHGVGARSPHGLFAEHAGQQPAVARVANRAFSPQEQEAAEKRRAERGIAVKLFVFDFDQTVSVIHVFKCLAGWERQQMAIPPPYALTELGQTMKVFELNKDTKKFPNGFAVAALGGELRVRALRQLFLGLQKAGAEIIIATRGLVGVCSKCLDDCNLLDCVNMVYGRIGDDYGHTAFDQQAAQLQSQAELHYIGEEYQADWETKDVLVSDLMQERGLSWEQCVIVEDDYEEIRYCSVVCRTLYVEKARGMEERHLYELANVSLGLPADHRNDQVDFNFGASGRAASRDSGPRQADNCCQSCTVM